MTREEAIDHIKDIICENNTIKPNIVVFEQEKEALYMAIEALEQQPGWIPVSEDPPKEGEDVLACFYADEENYKMMVSRRSDYNYWSGVGRTADMVAWMPLPQPYKAESEERNDT